jgi:hypothetical protein
MKSVRKLPPNTPSHWLYAVIPGRNLLATWHNDGISFLHIPPVASQKPVDGWSVPPFSFHVFDFAVYPPENILAVAEHKEL